MSVEKIVLNASPLILLCNSELWEILPGLFEEMVVPEAVWQEIVNGSEVDQAALLLPQLDWLRREEVVVVPEVQSWDLGAGETAVLSYGLVHSEYGLVLDDRLARKCAKSFGLRTIGTGSILIMAKEAGLIETVEGGLRRLQEAGMWISEAVIEMLKSQAGE